MAIQDKIFGKPLATSEERAEQIGVGAGIPIFGLDALTSAAYGPEAALALLIPLGMHRHAVPSAHHHRHSDPAGDRLFQLSADHCCLPQRRRQLYRRHGEPGRESRAAGRRGADDRLHPDRGRRHLGRRDRDDLRTAQISTPHPGALSADSGHPGGRESARGKGYRHRLHRAHVSLHRHLADADCGGRVQDLRSRRPSPSRWTQCRRRCRRRCSFWACGC